jgi:hypothetical protein
MTRESKLTSYDEHLFGPVDLDENNQPFAPYHPTPPGTEYDDTFPQDPVPLFLSEPDEPEDGFEFEMAGNRSAISSRILKASFLVLTAAGISFAILSVPNPLALFANAKASLVGSAADQPAAPAPSSPPPAAAVQLVSNAPPAQAVQPAAVVAAPPPSATARERVTRDDIAAALRAAHHELAVIPQPVQQQQAAPAPARRMDADEAEALMKRAKGLIAIGDIAPARLLLERAAEAQEAGAALLLAQTYDPDVLGAQDMRSITPDPAAARRWYQKAAQLGSPDARQRLAEMQN